MRAATASDVSTISTTPSTGSCVGWASSIRAATTPAVIQTTTNADVTAMRIHHGASINRVHMSFSVSVRGGRSARQISRLDRRQAVFALHAFDLLVPQQMQRLA
jgi:hypothetical protein